MTLGQRVSVNFSPGGKQFDLAGNEASQLASYCCERGLPLLLHVNEPVGHEYAGKGTVQ